METRAHYIAVGTFVLTGVLLAFVAVLWLGRVQFSQQFSIYDIFFTGPVTGLGEGAAVQYNGILVGRVVDIRVDPDNVEQIRVRTEINDQTIIKFNAVASLETNLLSGVSFIQIRGGTREAPVLAAEKGQSYPVIASRRSPFERLQTRAPQLLEHLIEVTDNLNTILGDRNQKAISDSLANIQEITTSVAEHRADISGTLTGADTALTQLALLLRSVNESYGGKDGLKDQIAGTLADYDKLARNLAETNHQLQLTLQDARPGVHEFSQRTLGQVGDLVSDTRQLISGLTRLAAEIERDPTRFLFGDRREGYRPK